MRYWPLGSCTSQAYGGTWRSPLAMVSPLNTSWTSAMPQPSGLSGRSMALAVIVSGSRSTAMYMRFGFGEVTSTSGGVVSGRSPKGGPQVALGPARGPEPQLGQVPTPVPGSVGNSPQAGDGSHTPSGVWQ